jgi:hypothetical protein
MAFRWQDEEQSWGVSRRLRPGDTVSPAYSALLLALWEARRIGAHAVVLSTHDVDVAAQLAGAEPPAPGMIGPYLQIRALRHAFRSVEIRHLQVDDASEILKAASSRRTRQNRRSWADLPLWACTALS